MTNFKLEPVDILININHKNDPFSRLKRWAVGPYSHVSFYMGELRIVVHRRQGRLLRFPMLFESNGRGVVLQALSNRYSQEVVVLRLRPEYRNKIPRVLTEAVKLASDPQSYYDYLCIVKSVLLRVACEKLHLPMPLSWQRDERQICSEAVLEVFLRARVRVLPTDIVPLPGDFVDSPLLEKVWGGTLSAEMV